MKYSKNFARIPKMYQIKNKPNELLRLLLQKKTTGKWIDKYYSLHSSKIHVQNLGT